MNRILHKSMLVGLFLGSIVSSDALVRFMQPNGFGSRAFSLANNYVALSNDVSAVYWNPAALSFSQALELHISAATYGLKGSSDFYGIDQTTSLRRLKIPSAGLMFSIPATRGGLTFAVAYNNPVIFDDLSVYSGKYNLPSGEKVNVENVFKTAGGLNYWSGSVGLQVAPKLGVGLAVSFINGSEEAQKDFFRSYNGYVYDGFENDYSDKIHGKYSGIDARGGVYYKTDKYALGARFVLPQIITMKETIEDHYVDNGRPVNEETENEGTLYSSYSCAAGASVTLKFMTLTFETRATLPFDYRFPSEDIPESSQAQYFKVGGGAGVEFPLIVKPILLRAGYSFDEIDFHQYAIKYDAEDAIDWSDDNLRAGRNKHQLTFGVGFYSSSVSFDVAYGFSTWQIIQSNISGEDVLKQDFSQNKITATLSLRY